MNRPTFSLAAALRPLLLCLAGSALLTVPQAQQSKNRVGLVNVQQLVAGMPGSASYVSISKKADTDLAAQQKNLVTLANKASSSPTAANKAALTKAQQTFQNAQKSYQTQLNTAAKPLMTKLDASIARVAKANGYSVVMDSTVARRSQLVVYANTATDLTQAVLKDLKK